MEIKLYNFHKRINSTKIPAENDGTVFEGELKTDFTLTGLTVKFAFEHPGAVPYYNYAYIVPFNRYYFITDWFYSGGLWHAQLAVDVLASNRSEILASTQYVERSTSNYDSMLIDSAYMPTGEAHQVSEYLSPNEMWGVDLLNQKGVIVMGVVTSSSYAIGAVTYYIMSVNTFNNFMISMLSSINWAGISATEISQELQKALINPTQYIVTCRWYPLDESILQGFVAVNSIGLGWWNFYPSGTVCVLNNPLNAVVSYTEEITVPKHPLYNTRRAFSQLSPYSQYVLKFPPFGVFELDSTQLVNKNTIGLMARVSLLTGDCTVKIVDSIYTSTAEDNAFYYYNGSIGVPIAIGQIAGDIGNYKNALLAGGVAGLAGALG